MILHIVRPNENIYMITEHYRISLDELISNNRHVKDFTKLIPGTKIKIPQITYEIEEELEATEPFVEEYYDVFDKQNEEIKKKPIKFPPYYKKYNK